VSEAKPSWDDYFLGMARAAARRSSCQRSKVGAVVVAPDNTIRGTGYNDAPPGKPGCESCPHRDSNLPPGSSAYSKCVAVHAEANALLDAGKAQAMGSTLYVTRLPCDNCQKLIEAAGIARVVWPVQVEGAKH